MNCLLAFGCPVETQRYRICRAVFFAMHQTSGIRQMQEYLKAAKIDMQLKTHSSTGEKGQLNDCVEDIAGRKIIAFPDVDGYDIWKQKAE